MNNLAKKIKNSVTIGLLCLTYHLVFVPGNAVQANFSDENAEAAIEPEEYSRIRDDVQTTKQEVSGVGKTIKQTLQEAKAYIKDDNYDEAEYAVNKILIKKPANKKALRLKNKINAFRHLESMAEIGAVYEKEKLKNLEILEEEMIPYTERMRFPEEEDFRRVQERIIPDKTERFEEMKDSTSKMRIITDPALEIPKDIKDALNLIISFEFYEVPLLDVLAFIREKTNVNIVTGKDLSETLITLKLNNVTIETALTYILPDGVSYSVEDNSIIYISNDKLELRIYDIRDLLINLDDRVASRDDDNSRFSSSSISGSSSFSDSESKGERRNANQRVAELIRIITETIKPQSWTEEFGRITSREDRPGDLIIVNTDKVHKQVEDILTSMRSMQHLQVSIEARFIQMTDKFLKDIGVALQNIKIVTSNNSDNPELTDTIELDVDTSAGGAGDALSQGLNLTYSILKDFQVDFLLNAVQESEDAEILTSPRITLSNTQRGSIRVVNEISYVASFEIISQVPQPVIAIVEDGTVFDVRPIVSADRKHVFLEVHPNLTVITFKTLPFPVAVPFDSLSGGTTFQTLNLTIEQPIIRRQELSVTVDVPDRGTLMIGGLGTSEKKIKSGGVPFLKSIPFIGRLFSRDSEVIVRTNLIIILKPTIIIMDEELKIQKIKN
ncbi:MAG: type II secretion system protein GspD [Candidatus Anammoxibacter sp.]